MIRIRDNGIGFDQRHAERLFQVFQRLHTDAIEGSGIGLSIVHRIVTRHGGRIWATSRPGEGAAFSFTLGPDTAGAGWTAGPAAAGAGVPAEPQAVEAGSRRRLLSAS